MTGAAGPAPARLSFNQITADRWSLPEVVDACAEAGIGWVAPWRHKVAETGIEASAAKRPPKVPVCPSVP